MNWPIFTYNLWIAVTSITGFCALALGIYLLRHKDWLWILLAFFFFLIAIECGDSALTLGMNANSSCRITSISFILKRMGIRFFECLLLMAINAYVFTLFKTRKRVDRRTLTD